MTVSHRKSPRNSAKTPLRRPQRVRRSRPIVKVALPTMAILASILLWAIVARALAPRSNTSRQSFDAIIILGTPADGDGNPTPELLDRITEGVHEYERGVAPRILVTGAAAHNRFVEAEVMARVAEAQGVPASVIFTEPQAINTIQNACYSERILSAHGWRSAEVVSAESHLPRVGMIFSHLPIEWRVHAAPGVFSAGIYRAGASVVETFKTARYLVWSRWVESCSR